MTAALAFENVDILFTGLQGRKREAAIKAALASLDQGRSRAEIQAAAGVVVGVAGASLSIAATGLSAGTLSKNFSKGWPSFASRSAARNRPGLGSTKASAARIRRSAGGRR